MIDSNKDPLANIDFGDLFSEGQEGLSMDRVEKFLNKVVDIASDKAKAPSHQLVRVVHGRKVLWMTQEQASRLLEDDSDTNLQQDVERALRGDIKFLRQELEILLTLAFYTYNQYASLQAVSKKALDHIEPSLQRRKQEINEGISQTTEAEQVLQDKRAQYPLLEEYEEIMGSFLNEKSKGNLQKAKELARKLNEKKQKYLLLSRAIEPDVRTIYYYRLNLQKTKKRILNTQNELLSSRMDELIFEINEIKKNLTAIKEEIAEAEEQVETQSAFSIDEMDEFQAGEAATAASEAGHTEAEAAQIEKIKQRYAEKSSELNALNQESKLVQKHESAVNGVINHIAENVLNEPEHKVDVKSTYRSAPKKIDTSQLNKDDSKSGKSKSSGMHFGKHRDE